MLSDVWKCDLQIDKLAFPLRTGCAQTAATAKSIAHIQTSTEHARPRTLFREHCSLQLVPSIHVELFLYSDVLKSEHFCSIWLVVVVVRLIKVRLQLSTRNLKIEHLFIERFILIFFSCCAELCTAFVLFSLESYSIDNDTMRLCGWTVNTHIAHHPKQHSNYIHRWNNYAHCRMRHKLSRSPVVTRPKRKQRKILMTAKVWAKCVELSNSFFFSLESRFVCVCSCHDVIDTRLRRKNCVWLRHSIGSIAFEPKPSLLDRQISSTWREKKTRLRKFAYVLR